MASLSDFIQPSDENRGKIAKKEKEKKQKPKKQIIEGTLLVLPDCRYTAGQYIQLSGLGSIFDAVYRTKKVTHTIRASGYETSIEVYRELRTTGTGGSRGSGGSGGSGGTETRRDQATTQTAEEGLYIKIDKSSGEKTIVGK